MKAQLALILGISLLIIGIIVLRNSHPEIISTVQPAGYAVAQKIETVKDEAFVSALEYAEAFKQTLIPVAEAAPMPKVEKATTAKSAKKHHTRRHLAKAHSKKHKLVAKR